MKLRPYQQKAKDDVGAAWASGNQNVVIVLPTGAGKTVVLSSIVHDEPNPVCVIAHRQELVTQISVALAREGIRHKIIGPKNVVKLAVKLHMNEMGRSFYDPNSQVAVAGVDTLLRRDNLGSWANKVKLWVTDECHHISSNGGSKNKWFQACEMFPNARGLGVTATPVRADGAGLGRHADGLFDEMIVGPNMRDLIEMGFLTEYRIFCPPNDIDLTAVDVSQSTGDYSKNQLTKAVRKSHIVGDVVGHYKKIADGKLGITFATDVETATDIAAQFNAAGVPAEVVSAKTSDADRVAILQRFKRRELKQLVNVDLFGEGFDLPAIEVVSMARPTQSYSLFAQQFGRALRLLDGKTEAIIIDHVGNVVRHGLPDAAREWTLDRRDKRSSSGSSDAIPLRACSECTGVYERNLIICPWCGHKETPTERSGPQHVDGDLVELDPATLEQMRGEVAKMDAPVEVYSAWINSQNIPKAAKLANIKRHTEKQQYQAALRDSMGYWAGVYKSRGMSDREIQKTFYLTFGVDVLSAQALGKKDAFELLERVNDKLGKIL